MSRNCVWMKVSYQGTWGRAIPMSDVEAVRQTHETGVEIHVYAGAGHGFNCDQHASYNADSAKLARSRSLGFLQAALKAD